MTNFGYCRVSSAQQEHNFSLETQKEKLLKENILEENIIRKVGSASTLDRLLLSFLLNQT